MFEFTKLPPVKTPSTKPYRPPVGNTGHSSGGANVLRLDEDDMIHHIDDAFSAQQMVPNTTIRVDRATLRKMKNAEVQEPSSVQAEDFCVLLILPLFPGSYPRMAQPEHPEPIFPYYG